MPQLSIETFVTQYFWLLIIFFSFLILSTLYVLPKIAEIKKTRLLLQNFARHTECVGSEDFSPVHSQGQRSEKLLSSYKC